MLHNLVWKVNTIKFRSYLLDHTYSQSSHWVKQLTEILKRVPACVCCTGSFDFPQAERLVSLAQETFQDSHLGIKWEIFPLMGKNWDKKLLLGGNFGFLLGKNIYFPFTSQYWEYAVNVFPSYTQSWEQYGKSSQFIPNIVNYGGTFPQVIPRIVNNMDKFPKLFPALGMI